MPLMISAIGTTPVLEATKPVVTSRYQNYTVNVNQYSQRTVPGSLDVLGVAAPNSTVTVNLQPTYRHSNYFRADFAINNASAAAWQGITNVGVLANGASADIV